MSAKYTQLQLALSCGNNVIVNRDQGRVTTRKLTESLADLLGESCL